jgi:hypothetical protein
MKKQPAVQHTALAATASTGRRPVARLLPALIFGLAASGASAQICSPLDPVFLAEGPVTSVVDLGGGNGTITAMGVTFQVLPETPIASPTASLTMSQFASTVPFPGRTQGGYLGATVIATGCVKNGANGPYAVADDVFSDVAENVVLGVVTAPLTGTAADGSGGSFGVNNRPVSRLTDARMPAAPVANAFGFPVTPESVAVGAQVAVEGYYSNDGSGVLHVWDTEVAGGTLAAPNTPQVSIQRFRCANTILIRGGIYPTPGQACNFGNPYSLALFDGAGNPIPFDAGKDLDVVNGVPGPDEQFCAYTLRPAVTQCPAEVKVELRNAGVPIAEATAP